MNESKRAAWHHAILSNNVAMVQLLGLCPLLAATTSLVRGLSLGLFTLVILIATNVVSSSLRHLVAPQQRVLVSTMTAVFCVGALQLLVNAYLFALHREIGFMLPLIAVNCILLCRARDVAAKTTPAAALADALATGLGYLLVLTLFGALRELIDKGTLFANMQLLFGPAAQHWQRQALPSKLAFSFATTPAGAFLLLGLLIAVKNLFGRNPAPTSAPQPNSTSASLPPT